MTSLQPPFRRIGSRMILGTSFDLWLAEHAKSRHPRLIKRSLRNSTRVQATILSAPLSERGKTLRLRVVASFFELHNHRFKCQISFSAHARSRITLHFRKRHISCGNLTNWWFSRAWQETPRKSRNPKAWLRTDRIPLISMKLGASCTKRV